MKCTKCGTDNAESSKFCIGCGEPLSKTTASEEKTSQNRSDWGETVKKDAQKNQNYNGANVQGKQYANQNINMQSAYMGNMAPSINQVIPDYKPGLDYRPLGMWTYFAYDILFAVPIVGWIVLLILAFGAGKNVNLKNYARSKFCLLIILVILIILLSGAGMGTLAFLNY